MAQDQMKLKMPENVSMRWEMWQGFGRKEAVRTAAITGIVLAICVAACLITRSRTILLASVVIVMLTTAACVFLFGRIEGQTSIYEFMTTNQHFRSEQQEFFYVQRDEVTRINYVPEKEKEQRN